MEEIRQAVPDETLNISGQEERLRQIAAERLRVEEQISGGGDGGGDGGEGRGRRGGGLNGREREMERKEGGYVPQKEHTYEILPGEHEENVVQRNRRHNQFQDKNYPPPTQFNPATESRQYWDSRSGSHPQAPPAAASYQPGLHESTGSSYPHPASSRSSQSGDQHSVAAGLGQPPGQHRAYAGPPGQPTPALEVGSPVQLVRDSSRHGVVRWLGTLPEIQGAIAGVELDEPMDGCGDGEWNGHRYFTCLPGRAFFCPVTSLRPDPRIPPATQPAQHGGQPDTNPLNKVPDWESEDQHTAGDQIQKYTGERRGIQGHQNSCYLDATIFGLFALSDVFDSLFLDKFKSLTLTSLQPETPTANVQKEVGAMLWKGIVNPLRKNGAVRFESVMRLRNKLEELGKMEGITAKEKDPEEFLNMLFKHTLHVDPFIHIKRPSGTEPEFFIQLFVEFDKSLKVPTIQALLRNMFKEQHISFSEVPSKLLVQVPRYGKQFQIYKRIVPGIKLDPTPLMCNQDTCFICGETAPEQLFRMHGRFQC
ncbi:Ubiquitin carboxyl-terminal hydrolase CYLD [Geodia barretti]|uniref:ubiquitinyl hydrolase 1 n=1 Tax=Geodia barretti TaxID=519541 RepID=A0AA35RSI6_GEOBA|nr:Ubiquitin carboxyl-terminal hydrolase CYLD [Geodia barretti]